jgi:hypothetical protein
MQKNNKLTDAVIEKITRSAKVQGNNPNLKTKSELYNQINNLDSSKLNLLNKIIPFLIKYIGLISFVALKFSWFWKIIKLILTHKWLKTVFKICKWLLFSAPSIILLCTPDPTEVIRNISSISWIKDNFHSQSQRFMYWLWDKLGEKLDWEEIFKNNPKFIEVIKDKYGLRLVKNPSTVSTDDINRMLENKSVNMEINNNSSLPVDHERPDILNINQDNTSWYKNKYLWIGLGIIMVGFIANIYIGDNSSISQEIAQPPVDDAINSKLGKILDKTIDKPIRSTLFKNKF